MIPSGAGGTPDDQSPNSLSAQADQLRRRFEDEGNRADLDEAVRIGREAYRLAETAVGRGLAGFRLGITFGVVFEHTGRLRYADEALLAFDAADRLLPGGHPDLPAVSANRAAVLVNRHLRSGSLDDLTAAIAAAQQGVSRAADGDPRMAGWRSNLGGLLRTRFQRTGARADLDAAIEHNRLAVSLLTGRERQIAAFHAALAASLSFRFAVTYADADLDESIEVARRALALAPAAGRVRWMALGVLAAVLKVDFERSGDIDRLGEAIDCLRETTDTLPHGHADLPVNLANLTSALLKRHESFNAREDLDEAVAFARRALAEGHASAEADLRRRLAAALLRLGPLLAADGDAPAGLDACDEARRAAERSLELLPLGHPDRTDAHTLIGNALMNRFGVSGDPADARKAGAAYRAALGSTAPGDPRRPLILTNLGTFHLGHAAGGQPEPRDFAEAARALREAVRSSGRGHPVWAHATASLAVVLLRAVAQDVRLDETDPAYHGSALREALDLFAQLDDVAAAPPSLRLAAHQMTASIRVAEGDLAAACAEYTAAVDLLPQTAWHGLGQDLRERILADRTGLGSDAAAAHIAAGAPERALELLEQSRGVLWSQRLARRFVDARLEAALPEQAMRLRGLTGALDAVD
jgi:tetratricopeptide (TPR) repeat protein